MTPNAPDRKELRKFSIALIVVAGGIGSVWLWRDHRTTAFVFYLFALWGLLSALLFPPLVRPVHWVLTKIARALGWFNTRLILIVIFYVLFTPIGLLLRLLGKDLLDRKIDPEAGTYWIDREKEEFDRKRYERQF
ncbi:MAG: SxtJ family membrane protein [Candidatus Eisenbacteria bacterium]